MKIVVVIASPFMSCAAMLTFIDSSEVASMLAGDLLNFHDRVRELGGQVPIAKRGRCLSTNPTDIKQRGESEPGSTFGAACGGCC